LPGGKGVLFVVKYQESGRSDIAVADVTTGRHTLLTPGAYARYASGHLFYTMRGGPLMMQPFDPRGLVLSGQSRIWAEDLWYGAIGAPDFVPDVTVSTTGTLMYTTGSGVRDSSEVVWVMRDGSARQVDPTWTDQLGGFGGRPVMLSPDGRRLAVTLGGEIWIKQLDRGPLFKLTFEGGFRPEWTPDGASVGYLSDRDSLHRRAYIRRATGGGSAEPLMDDPRQVHEVVFSRDGRWLVYRIGGGGTSDLDAVRRDGDSTRVPLVVSRYQESQPALSPNGRWLTYVTLETGRPEVWVRPFPNTRDGSWQISPRGGTEPAWAHSGRELFYRDGDGNLVSVPITEASTFTYGEPRVLFSARNYRTGIYRREYAVAPDDQRFIFVRRLNETRPDQLVVIEQVTAMEPR
jgi:hypothetical protein